MTPQENLMNYMYLFKRVKLIIFKDPELKKKSNNSVRWKCCHVWSNKTQYTIEAQVTDNSWWE